MITWSKDIQIICDIQPDEWSECWRACDVTLTKHERDTIAYSIFRNLGWVVGSRKTPKEKDICPFCSKGIKKL